mgnify:CR=1 FL=1
MLRAVGVAIVLAFSVPVLIVIFRAFVSANNLNVSARRASIATRGSPHRLGD